MNKPELVSYDFDGVITTGNYSHTHDQFSVVITGRCIDEYKYVYRILAENKMMLPVYFNPISYSKRGDHTYKSRLLSGKHKARILKTLSKNFKIAHYEDDPLQIEIIKLKNIKDLTIIHVENKNEASL